MKRITKKHRAAMTLFGERVRAVLERYHAVEIHGGRDGGYNRGYEVETPAGLLEVNVWDHPESSAAVMQRFDDVQRAERIASPRHVPFNGKWNFHFFVDDDTLNRGIDYWQGPFEAMMRHAPVPAPAGRWEVVCGDVVLVNRKDRISARKWLTSSLEHGLPERFPTDREAYTVRPMVDPCARWEPGYWVFWESRLTNRPHESQLSITVP